MGQIFINIFTILLEPIASVELSENFFFTRSWYQIGEFEININAHMPHADAFQRGRIIQLGWDKYKAGLITSVEKSLGDGGKQSEMIKVSGSELKYIFRRRITVPDVDEESYGIVTNAETVMKSFVTHECVENANAKRNFTALTVAASTGFGIEYALNTRYKNLADELEEISKTTDLGWYVRINDDNDGFVFETSLGVDRTEGQSGNPRAVFSHENDTLKSVTIKDAEEKYSNMIYIGGRGEGVYREVYEAYDPTEPEDVERVELFIDAKDVINSEDLEIRGANKLIEYGDTITIPESEILTYSKLKYQTDYDLGDLVTVKAGATSVNTQISEVKESWSAGGYEINITFGKPSASLVDQLRQLYYMQSQSLIEMIGGFDMVYVTVSGSATLAPTKNTCYGLDTGANGIRLGLPPSSAQMTGLELEFIKLDTAVSMATLIPTGAETINGMPFLFVFERYRKIRLLNTGTGWLLTHGILIADSGWINRSDYRNKHIGTMNCPYDNKNGSFFIGEPIVEAVSGNRGYIITDSGANLVLWLMSGTGFFTNDRQVTGQISGATALVNTATTTKNLDYDFYHGFVTAVRNLFVELILSSATTGTDATSFIYGKSGRNGGDPGYGVYHIDTNNFRFQMSYNGGVFFTDDGGVVTHLDVEDWSYRIIAKLII